MSASSENEDLEIQEEQSSDEEEVASEEEDAVEGESDEDEESGADVPDVNASATESDEESGAEVPDVNASATESDEDDDDEVDDDEDTPPTIKNKVTLKPTVIEKITNDLNERHEKRKGRQLYIRFPEKLPEDIEEFQKKVKALSDLIVEGHKPRQKHARFCLVDFATTEDRDLTLKQLSKNDSKIIVSLPKTDNENFIKSLVEKKIQQREKKRAKNLLRKQSKKNVMEKKFTPTLLLLNLPGGTSNAQLKELFPDSVDIQTKAASGKYAGKMIATVTLPSTEDAQKNFKRSLELGGNKLIMRYNTSRKLEFRKKNNAPKKGPLAPVNLEGTSSESAKISPKKRSISENGSPPEKKFKGKKPFPQNKNGKPASKGKPGGKPNKPKMQNKQKNQPQKKGKGVLAAAAAAE